ncbi:Synaptotagmin-5 (NTMC2T2.1) (Synaptotagmin E) [Durusdinium trenchii]|uniref:Synaptotagmin-5 (NTMC2T2.1) (Synaptotagmin E) n=1 Tax=Durusdinium trenchii TaxID=1381693 RepID=A0ABP0PUU5_9DINO
MAERAAGNVGGGRLVLEAVAGKKLKKLESFLSKQDPYVVFEFRGETQRTATDKDASAEPRWKEKGLDRKAEFEIGSDLPRKEETVDLRVMNDNGKKTDKLIGEGKLELSKLFDAQEGASFSIELVNGSKKAGKLSLHGELMLPPPTKTTKKKKSREQALASEGTKNHDLEGHHGTDQEQDDDEADEEEPGKTNRSANKRRPTQDSGPSSSSSSSSSNKGTLIFTALRAKKLKNLQMILAQDPYVKVTVETSTGTQSGQTLESSGKNPTWDSNKNNRMAIACSGTPQKVLIEVYDAEVLRADRIIGSVSHSFEQLLAMASPETAFKLKDPKGKDAGTLFVDVQIPKELRSDDIMHEEKEQEDEREAALEAEDEGGARDLGPPKSSDKKTRFAVHQRQDSEEGKIEWRAGKVVMTVHEGIDLKNVQRIGYQDPYVKGTLLPWDVPTGKTKTLSGRNPKWTSGNVLEVEFPGAPAPGTKPEVKFEVFDEELALKDRFIGGGSLDLTKFVATNASQKPQDGEAMVALKDKKFRDAGTLRVTISFEPVANEDSGPSSREQDQLMEQVVFEEGVLTVMALSAALTRSVETLSKQDPYMQVSLLPWGGERQQGRTRAASNAGKQVTWTESHEHAMKLFFPGKSSSGEKPNLFVQIFDEESVMKDRLIGFAHLDLSSVMAQLSKSPGESVEKEIELVYNVKKNKTKPCGSCRISLCFRPGPVEDLEATTSPTCFKAPDGKKSDVDKATPCDMFVTVHRASSLLNRARFGKQDPYVKFTLLPWRKSAKTQWISDGGVNVEWTAEHGNSLTLAYPGARTDELPMARVEVFDSQVGGDRLIGWRELDASCFLRPETERLSEVEIPLIARGGKSAEKNPAGMLTLSMHCGPAKGSTTTRSGLLRVKVLDVTTTIKGDWFSESDPYVRVFPWPGVGPQTPYTTIVKANGGKATAINDILEIPVFDYGANGCGSESSLQSLRVEVMDRDTFTSDDLLGFGIKELGEVFTGGEGYDPNYAHEVPLHKKNKKKSMGTAYMTIEFLPGKFRKRDVLEGLKTGPGELRVWALEARNLTHVGGMLDRKQDPFFAATLQAPGAPDPGKATSWNKKQRSKTASDAGKQCIWNAPVHLEHSASDASYATSGRRPGVLHIAVCDEGITSDTVIGTYALDLFSALSSKDPGAENEGDDFWVSIFDKDGKKSGEVRIGVEFVQGLPKDVVALRHEFGFVSDGTLHILVAELDGVAPKEAKKVSGQVLMNGKVVSKIPQVSTDPDGKVCWNHAASIDWVNPSLNPETEPVMPVPTIHFEFTGSSGKTFGINRNLGGCAAPIVSFLPHSSSSARTRSIEKTFMICEGKDAKDTARTLRVVGIFAPKNQDVPGAVLAAMTHPGVDDGATQGDVPKARDPPLKQSLPGRLHLRVVEGKDLTSRDRFGKQDPYISGMLVPGGSKFKTDVCLDGDRAPRWTEDMNSYHVVLVEDADAAVVSLRCMDQDDLVDDLIGFVDIPVLPIALHSRKVVPGSNETQAAPSGDKIGALEARSRRTSLSAGMNNDLQGQLSLWASLLPSRDSAGPGTTRNATVASCTKVFSTRRWSEFCASALKLVGASQSSRKERLISFYEDLEEDGIAVIDDIPAKVDQIVSSYPDDEPTNKALFTKLFEKYRPDESCPPQLWQQASATDELSLANPTAIVGIIAQVEGPAKEFLRGQVKALTKPIRQQLSQGLVGRFGDGKLNEGSFEDIARATVARMVFLGIESGIFPVEGETASKRDPAGTGPETSAQASNDQGSALSSKVWWTLRDERGRSQGKLLLETWFTEDWVPSKTRTAPELSSAGTVWLEIQRAAFETDKDWIGQQDPFVSVQWSGGQLAKTLPSQKTKVLNNAGKEAEWNAVLRLDYTPDIARSASACGQTPTLIFEARDKDVMTSDLIGETRVPLIALAKHSDKIFPRALPLINSRKGETTRAGTLHIRMMFEPGESSASEPPEVFRVGASASRDADVAGPPPVSGRVLVDIVGARGLKDVQWVGKMDPRATLRLWPNNQTCTTKEATDQDQNPTWKETHALDTEDGEMGLLSVDVTTRGNSLGTLEIALCTVFEALAENCHSAGIEHWFPLVSSKSKKVKRCGEIQLKLAFEDDAAADDGEEAADGGALHFVPGPGKLHVRVHGAVDLRQVNLTGKQDPFVELEGVGWRKPFKVKTNVDENSGASPQFDFSCCAPLEWAPKDTQVPSLKLEIKDRGMLTNACIFSGLICLAPWVLGPGQAALVWYPTYTDSEIGPYVFKPKHGALRIDLQFIPDAPFPGKPRSAFSRSAMKRIEFPDVPRKGEVHVQVISGRHFTDVQLLGKQDPYVKLTLIAGGANSDAKLSFSSAKTSMVNDGGSNPKWGEDLLLPYDEASLGLEKGTSTPVLLVEAFDANPKLMGDKLIGRTAFPVFPVILDGGQVADAWYPIVDRSGKKAGEVHLGVQFRREGEGKRVLPSELPENTLNVVVTRGRNLYNAGDGVMNSGAQDPQVQLEFVGFDRVYKTQVAQDEGTEPTFDERLKLEGCMPDARGTMPRLRCTVVDHDVTGDSFIGMFEFALSRSIMGNPDQGVDPKPHEQWFQLLDKDQRQPRGELQLILKRGPFPGDEEDGGDADAVKSLPRLYFDLESLTDFSDGNGKVPKKPFVRALSFAGSKKISTCDSRTVDGRSPEFANEMLVVPVAHVEPASGTNVVGAGSVTLGVYEKKWSIRGLRPVLIAEAFVPKLEKLASKFALEEPAKLSLPLKATSSAQGPTLGRLNLNVNCLPRVAGQLRVAVNSAKEIQSQDLVGKNDLRVELLVLNGAKAHEPEMTSTKDGAGSQATWGETLHLLYSNENETEAPKLRARVVDVDTVGSDSCGECFVQLLPLLTEAFRQGEGSRATTGPMTRLLSGGKGEISLEVSFTPDSNIFERKRKEENSQIMELKRMWNILDENHDSRLTREELRHGFSAIPECAAFFGVNEQLFAPENLDSTESKAAMNELFDEMNANDDDIVDFDEFRRYIEFLPQRQKLKNSMVSQKRQMERDAHAAELRRQREREQERARKQEQELQERRTEEKEKAARRRAEQRRKQEENQRRRVEELARLAQKRAVEEAQRLAEETQKLKTEQERRRRAKVKQKRLDRARPEDVMLWRTRDVVEWLASDLELPAYSAGFVEGAVDGPLLVALTDEELESQLGVHDPLHRRKILLRAARLFQMHKELTEGEGGPKGRESRKDKKKSKVPGDPHVVSTSSDNHLVRIKLAQQYKKEQASRNAKTKEDAVRQQIWKFEYDDVASPGGARGHGKDEDAFDWFKSEDVRAFEDSDSDSEDDDDDEGSFRHAMLQVRDRLIDKQPQPGSSIAAAEAVDTLDTLKNGEHIGSQSPSAKRIKSLPEEYWFKDQPAWWNSDGPAASRNTRGEVSSAIPEEASENEILDVIREAVLRLGRDLAQRRKTPTKLSQSSTASDRQKQMLLDVFNMFCELRNNASDRTEGLSRLKFQGGLKVLLGLDLTWTQFDRVFRLVSPARGDGTNGTVQFDEFYRVFRPVETRSSMQALQRALFAICETLLKSKVTLKQLFRGFDRNGSGSVSTAEFVSMMKSMSSSELSRENIYALVRCVDSDLDRRISFREFMEFWLVVYTQWLRHLSKQFERIESRSSGGGGNQRDSAAITLNNSMVLRKAELERLIGHVRETIELTFGKEFDLRHRQSLPGPTTALLRKLGMDIDGTGFDLEDSPRGAGLAAVRKKTKHKYGRVVNFAPQRARA